jgi:hypothetical protein
MFIHTSIGGLRMPYIRTRPLGDDDVTIEVRQRLWWTLWLFTKAVPLSTVRSSLNKLDWEIIELTDKLKAKLANRMALAEACHAEYEEAKNNRYDKFGISEWIYLDDKIFRDKVKPYTDRPKEDWRTFFSIGTIRQFKLENKPKSNEQGVRRAGDFRLKGHVPGESGGTIGVMMPEHQKFALHLREDNPDVNTFVMDKNLDKKHTGEQASDKKSQMRKLRQDNPFSPSEWGNHKEYESFLNEKWQQEFGN